MTKTNRESSKKSIKRNKNSKHNNTELQLDRFYTSNYVDMFQNATIGYILFEFNLCEKNASFLKESRTSGITL